MFRRYILSFFVAAGLSFQAMAADESEYYFTGSYSMQEFSIGGASAEPAGIDFTFGRQMNPNFSIEGRFGLGMSDDLGIELSNHYGVMFKAMPQTDGFTPYVGIGWNRIKVDTDFGSESDNDTTFALGVDVDLGSNWAVNIEWNRMYSQDGLDIDAKKFGFKYSW